MGDPSSDSNFSVEAEPWMKSEGLRADPSEAKVRPLDARVEEMDAIRDSVFNEPGARAQRPGKSEFQEWLETKRASVNRPRSLLVGVLVALVGGPFAVIGAMMTGGQTGFAMVYAVLFGPVTEELLKQAGMIVLLERRPYHIFSKWQLIIGALIGAALFAVIENLVYIHVYLVDLPLERIAFLATFRWRVCTSLHILCSLIGSLGMIKVWQRQNAEGKPADLSVAYPYLVAAIGVHGVYNLVAIITQSMGLF